MIRWLANLKPLKGGCVLTIGNFDGVHLGHKAVIESLARRGAELGLPVAVMLFEPQPLEYFLGDNAPSRLTRLREKILRLAELPVDHVLILHFNQTFANQEPEDFIRKVLVEGLHVKHLVVGDDFHFGKSRRGNVAMLRRAGEIAEFDVEDTPSFQVDGQRVSSTLIRDALGAGDLARAKKLLGRHYSVCGRVAHGQKRGRLLGFPTANIRMFRKNTPVEGVFAVTMTGIGGREIPGVANVGTRPTVGGGKSVLLETHLFRFDGEIYGRTVEVHFRKKIREELRFNSFEELRAQIGKDVAAAKEILADFEIS